VPTPRLTEDEVAARADTTVERVRELVRLGILTPVESTFERIDVLRARVVAGLEAKGIPADALSTALASGELTLGYLESGGRRFPRIEQTLREFAEAHGLSVESVRRMYLACGLAAPDGDERVREEDVSILRALPVMFGAGIDEEEVLRAVRVWGDGVRRIAQFQTHYFHHAIEEPFRRRGLRDNEAFEAAIREVGVRMGQLGEQMLGWLLRRHAETFQKEHEFEHVETALDHAGVRPRVERGVGAAAFADLSGYTHLTEQEGDAVAAGVSLTLARLVGEVAVRHRGEVVKMLGDGVHFHFPDPADAVRASLDIVDTVRPQGLPPAHIGVNAGPMIYEEGDYFGRTVNLAARIASQAKADQVFVGEDLRRVVEPDGFAFVEVGPFELKGIAAPVTLFEAVRA
jgi:adenylate cyclase